ncbi:uncharacterized protein BN461_00063 [Bacteroides sp. CAG:1076]|jgi:hypothetical protein|nr:uncharacterized protein BN461_00063 [Bacteroides sp. CAG:1076]
MKKILFVVGVLLCCLSIQAQDMKSLFIALPDSLSPMLTKVNREDFGDFLASNMKAEVKNRFGNTSEMLKLTDNYLKLKISKVSMAEMKLLPLNDSVKVICVVHTFEGPASDSSISFYDTSWKRLPADKFLTLPVEDAFYKTPASEVQADSLKNLRARADMFLLKADLSETDNTLSFTYATPDYLDKETAEEIKPYLVQEPLKYIWKEGHFVRL